MQNDLNKIRFLDEFIEVMNSMEDKKSLKKFMRDVATFRELSEMSCRWKAAQLLNNGESYRDVAKTTGLSTTTVTRVASWIKRGLGGYKIALTNNHAP